jgi:2-polyprenyl-6-methoxyphenol hydroxylase-like FAD-dependent oxidoreductase
VTSAPIDDVTIVGGGPAGSAAAIGLRAAGLPVTLIDQARPGAAGIGQTLPADAMTLLARLGAWDDLPASGRMRSAGIGSAWGAPELAWQDSFTHPLGTGWHVDRESLDPALRRAATASGARVLAGRRVAVARPANGGWLLDITGAGPGRDSARRVFTSFLVDASGRAALVGRRFSQRHVGDRLMAVHARLDPPARAAVARHALIESGPGGWWYGASRPDSGLTAVFFSDADVIRELRAATTAGWHSLLRKTGHLYDALGRPGRPAAVRTAAASSHCLVRVCGPGWAAVGDAATAWDPLSSAGVTMALWSGLRVAEAIGRARDGDETAIARYAAEVRRRYTAFLVERGTYYGSERRWPDDPFWSRRAATGPPNTPDEGKTVTPGSGPPYTTSVDANAPSRGRSHPPDTGPGSRTVSRLWP